METLSALLLVVIGSAFMAILIIRHRRYTNALVRRVRVHHLIRKARRFPD